MPVATLYTLTPNPALDLSGHVDRVIPNEKNYVYSERRDPGGNGINAARIAHRLGAPVRTLGFIGGATGQEIKSLLEKEGVSPHFSPVSGDNRINVTINNHADHRQTRLTFPGPHVSRAEVAQLFKLISKLKAPGLFIIGGSLPPGCPSSFHSRLIQAALERDLGVIADVPARHLNALTGHTPLLLIKPNQAELEEWFGRKLRSDTAIVRAARGLLAQGKRGLASLVCVSLAERGALLLSESQAWMGIAPKIRARGTVGAGDSLVGAMATRLAKAGVTRPADLRDSKNISEILTDALAWGMAAGAATAESAGTSLAQASEIRRLHKKVRIHALEFS